MGVGGIVSVVAVVVVIVFVVGDEAEIDAGEEDEDHGLHETGHEFDRHEE